MPFGVGDVRVALERSAVSGSPTVRKLGKARADETAGSPSPRQP
jgi:hypothetical protein